MVLEEACGRQGPPERRPRLSPPLPPSASLLKPRLPEDGSLLLRSPREMGHGGRERPDGARRPGGAAAGRVLCRALSGFSAFCPVVQVDAVGCRDVDGAGACNRKGGVRPPQPCGHPSRAHPCFAPGSVVPPRFPSSTHTSAAPSHLPHKEPRPGERLAEDKGTRDIRVRRDSPCNGSAPLLSSALPL